MYSFFVRLTALIFILMVIAPGVSATRIYQQQRRYAPSYITSPNYQYQGTTSSTLTCSSYTSASVWVGTLVNGVVVTIDSPDYILQNCIKNTAWLTYFTRFGNSVNLSISNTTRGVQITATSYDSDTISNMQNATWKNIITGTTTNNNSNWYSYSPSPSYSYNNQWYSANKNWYYDNTPSPSPYNQNSYYSNQGYSSYNDNQYYSNQGYYTTYQQNTYYVQPARTYRTGSSLFPNTNQMYRALSYISNGVKITLSSPDYNTMRYLQWYSFASLFTDLSGVSLSTSNISWGVEVTITAGNSSTVEQIQKAGYAIVYQ